MSDSDIDPRKAATAVADLFKTTNAPIVGFVAFGILGVVLAWIISSGSIDPFHKIWLLVAILLHFLTNWTVFCWMVWKYPRRLLYTAKAHLEEDKIRMFEEFAHRVYQQMAAVNSLQVSGKDEKQVSLPTDAPSKDVVFSAYTSMIKDVSSMAQVDLAKLAQEIIDFESSIDVRDSQEAEPPISTEEAGNPEEQSDI